MRLCALFVCVLVAFTMVAAYCGDGIVDYGSEQCDTGMRCVSRTNTLAWSGTGPSLGARTVTVAFRYNVLGYTGAGVDDAQLIYGLVITAGSTNITNAYTYTMSCTEVDNNIVIEVAPDAVDAETTTMAAWVQWTFGSTTCAAAFNATVNGGTWTPANLTSFSFRYNGAITSDIWLLSSTDAGHTFGSNGVCGTECCTAACKRTWATNDYGVCAQGTPAGALIGSYMCQDNGTCTTDQVVAPEVAYQGCGDGIVQPGEQCDTGLWLTPSVGSTGCGAISGTFDIAPGSDLDHICGSFTYQAYSTTLTYTSYMEALYLSPYNLQGVMINSTYTYQCYDNNSTDLTFTLRPSIPYSWSYFPTITMNWVYEKSVPTVNCSNWLEYPPGNLLLFQTMDFLYQDWWGNTTFFTNDPLVKTWRNNVNPRSTFCCTPICTFTNPPPDTPCQVGTPYIIPETDPWVCGLTNFGTCIQSASQTPTMSATPTNTPFPSVSPTETSTKTRTASPGSSATPSPSASATPSPSSSASVGASPSITASASITPSPSASTGASPSTTTTLTATGTAVVVPSASATGTGTATPSPSSINGTNTTASPSQPPVVAESAKTAWIIFSAVAGYAAVALTVVALLMLFMMRQSVLMRRAISAPQPAAPAPLASAATEIATAPLLKTGAERPHFQSRPVKNDTENEWDSF